MLDHSLSRQRHLCNWDLKGLFPCEGLFTRCRLELRSRHTIHLDTTQPWPAAMLRLFLPAFTHHQNFLPFFSINDLSTYLLQHRIDSHIKDLPSCEKLHSFHPPRSCSLWWWTPSFFLLSRSANTLLDFFFTLNPFTFFLQHRRNSGAYPLNLLRHIASISFGIISPAILTAPYRSVHYQFATRGRASILSACFHGALAKPTTSSW